MAIALVEIGTRAVRLLVADRDAKQGIRIVATGVERNPMTTAGTAPGSGISRDAALARLCDIVDKFENVASRHQVTEQFVFGTESLRRLGTRQIEPCRVVIHGLSIAS